MELAAHQIESIAKAVHEEYCKSNPGSRYDTPWEILPDDIQQANRDQASEFTRYVDLLGLVVVSDEKNADSIEQLTDEQIETVAKRIHEVWAKSKEAAGWKYGAVRDDEIKLHPMLIPYSELSEEEKYKDRDIAQSIVPLLRTAGVIVAKKSCVW